MTAEVVRTAWDAILGLLVWGAICAFAGWAIGYGHGWSQGSDDRHDRG